MGNQQQQNRPRSSNSERATPIANECKSLDDYLNAFPICDVRTKSKSGSEISVLDPGYTEVEGCNTFRRSIPVVSSEGIDTNSNIVGMGQNSHPQHRTNSH